jgi:flavin-dependent dehydrogenase
VTRETDVVIIGGGIVGCAAAYYLARRGVRPLLLERVQVVSRRVPIGQAIEDILLLAEYSRDGEWDGHIRYLPL